MKIIKFIAILILVSNCLKAQSITQQTVVTADLHQILQQRQAPNPYRTLALVIGSYQIPTLNPLDFEILDFQILISSIAAASGWNNLIVDGKQAATGYQLSTIPNGRELKDESDFLYRLTNGSVSVSSFVETRLDPTNLNISKFYSSDGSPFKLHFLVQAGGEAASGAFAYVSWGKARVTYTLRRINNSAPVPPALVGFSAFESLMTMDSLPASNRPHPSLFEEATFIPPGLKQEVPAKWFFPSAKAVSSEIWGFPGYRYTLMRGAVPGSGSPVSSVDGEGTNFTLSHDDGTAGAERAFFWVKEEKIE